jgi:hypothetical protein
MRKEAVVPKCEILFWHLSGGLEWRHVRLADLQERHSNPEHQDYGTGILNHSSVTLGWALSNKSEKGKHTSKFCAKTACRFFRICYIHFLAVILFSRRTIAHFLFKDLLTTLQNFEILPTLLVLSCTDALRSFPTSSSQFIMRSRFQQIALHQMFA